MSGTMTKCLLVLVSLFFAYLALVQPASARSWRWRRSAKSEYKMCVPDGLMDMCEQMASEETKSAAKIVCIPARDRIECLEKIKQREADFGTVDPEDMYVAARIPNEDFTVFEEIRTHEEPDAEFRYEAVVVIHKDLKLDSLQDLKGLNSCHTGVGRNVGYMIPLTKLKQKGIIGDLADPKLSPRENELKAFSTLFNKACIVGKWSPDPKINAKLKEKYSNLCALCEHPEKCDYPDNFSGYEGALRCLAFNGGQVAWTKVIYVKKFFGLGTGIPPTSPMKVDPEDFAYLCPDGTRAPVSGPPCRWAARPWQGYMTNADVVKNADELRRKIENLGAVGAKKHATWWEKVLELSDKTAPKESKVISPGDYLDKANYTDVIERDYGPPFKAVRICVTSEAEEKKCRDFSRAAFSRNVRPRFDCYRETSTEKCLSTIRDNNVDIVNVPYSYVKLGENKYDTKAIVAEQYGNLSVFSYAVAVVKKDSPYKSLDELRGAKSCHAGIDELASYNVPIYHLKKLVNHEDCNYSDVLTGVFSGSCLPGAAEKSDLMQSSKDKLCQQCVGDVDKADSSGKCKTGSSEAYSGFDGAFRCLAQGGGDVAFVKHDTVAKNTDGNNKASWAANLKSSDFELLCPKGGRVSVDKFEECNLAKEPAHMVITSNSKGQNEIDELRNALIQASTLYSENPEYFKMFGPYDGKNNLLFSDHATGLVSVSGVSEAYKDFEDILNMPVTCTT